MPNGIFEPLVQDIQAKLIAKGVDGISERELLVLLVGKVDRLGQPFWRLWTLKETAQAGAVVLFLLGAINWQALSQVLNGAVQAAGR